MNIQEQLRVLKFLWKLNWSGYTHGEEIEQALSQVIELVPKLIKENERLSHSNTMRRVEMQQAKITELEEENKRQQNIIDAKLKQYLELMKALDEGEIRKVITKHFNCDKPIMITPKEKEEYDICKQSENLANYYMTFGLAKTIVKHIKSKLTGGE